MGEDVTWNVLGDTAGLVDRFGKDRVRDTPISEAGFVGAGAGAAMVGTRPVIHMLLAPFLYAAFDQLVSIVAKATYLYGGQANLPVTLIAPMLYASGLAAQHSDRPYSTLMTIPGLKLIAPANPHDVKGMLKASIRDDNPVVSFHDIALAGLSCEVPDDDYLVPLGKAEVRRAGDDVTVVAIAGAVQTALAAADGLAAEGISAEVVDLRSIVPMDRTTVLESAGKTGRVVVVDVAHEMGSVASEVAAIVADEGFWSLRAPVKRVTTPHVHIPFSSELERTLFPDTEKVIAVARELAAADHASGGRQVRLSAR
jgi:pyruvate dehydrogenase E1 component beta subunit